MTLRACDLVEAGVGIEPAYTALQADKKHIRNHNVKSLPLSPFSRFGPLKSLFYQRSESAWRQNILPRNNFNFQKKRQNKRLL